MNVTCQNIVRNPLELFPSPLVWFHLSFSQRTHNVLFQFFICSLLRFSFFCFVFVMLYILQKFSFIFILFSSAPCKAVFFKGVMIILYFIWSGIVKVAASGLARQLQSVTFYWWRYRHMHITHLIFWPVYANLTLHISVMADIRHISPNHRELR